MGGLKLSKNIVIAAVVAVVALTAAFFSGTNVKPTNTAPSDTTSTNTASSELTDSEMIINPETGKDKYLTEPVPEGKPIPVDPQNTKITDKAKTCYLAVNCETILNNMELLDPDKIELVPDDGMILPKTEVIFYEGESVFDLLQREMKNNKIHMEFTSAPMYNSAYIEGINNLYEFDCGELSGWTYKINDWFPNYGSSRYQISEGDVIEWLYTCDLGRDVGNVNVGTGGSMQ